jgi:hypothetical protein
MGITDVLFAFAGAWLTAILARRKDIVALAKNELQRTSDEKKRVKGGLRRGLVLEFLLFAPASTVLILLLLPLFLKYFPMRFPGNLLVQMTNQATSEPVSSTELRRAGYTLVGVIGYVLPLAAIKHLVIRFVEGLLSQFIQLKDRDDREAVLPPGKKQIKKHEDER